MELSVDRFEALSLPKDRVQSIVDTTTHGNPFWRALARAGTTSPL